MAKAKLTPRQQEVRDLLDAGKTPAEVAKQLRMSENNVYQHIRRMGASAKKSPARKKTTTARRSSGTRSRSTTRATASKRTTARRSSGRKTTARRNPRPAPAPAPTLEVREMTPLQAIRHRRQEIESQITESSRRLAEAEKAYNAEKEGHGKLEASRADELKKLAAAEGALSEAKPKRKAPSRNGSGSKAAGRQAAAQTPAAAPAGTAPAAPAPPAQPEPEPAPVAAAPEPAAAAQEERPGVETVPEFAQDESDAFDESGEESQLVG